MYHSENLSNIYGFYSYTSIPFLFDYQMITTLLVHFSLRMTTARNTNRNIMLQMMIILLEGKNIIGTFSPFCENLSEI